MNLLPEQEEKLVNFQAITEHWDTDSSIQILEKNNWNLEKATYDFMTNSFRDEDLLYHTHVSASENPQRRLLNISSEITAELNRERETEPPKVGFFSKVRAFFNEIITPQSVDISKSAQEFLDKLREERPQWIPKFFIGTLKDAVFETNRIGKMLVIYIGSAQVSAGYSVQVLCNQSAVGALTQYYNIWAVDKETSDGRIAEKLLRTSDYPCLSIISVQNTSKPVVLSTLQGYSSQEQVLEFLLAQVTPVFPRNPRQAEYERERQLRASQDQELREAEIILKERTRQEAVKKEEEQRRRQMETEEKQRKENLKKEKINEIGPEPELTDPNSAFVSFRLPNGSKIERRFPKMRNVQLLYEFLEVNEYFDVEILFGFPSAVLVNRQQSLDEAGLYPKALVIVRKIEIS